MYQQSQIHLLCQQYYHKYSRKKKKKKKKILHHKIVQSTLQCIYPITSIVATCIMCILHIHLHIGLNHLYMVQLTLCKTKKSTQVKMHMPAHLFLLYEFWNCTWVYTRNHDGILTICNITLRITPCTVFYHISIYTLIGKNVRGMSCIGRYVTL